MLRLDSTHAEVGKYQENHLLVYPSGKPIMLHLLRCQGLAIVHYGFTLGRLGATTFSAFATMGWSGRFSLLA
jgi:hypothetical protein